MGGRLGGLKWLKGRRLGVVGVGGRFRKNVKKKMNKTTHRRTRTHKDTHTDTQGHTGTHRDTHGHTRTHTHRNTHRAVLF